MLSKCLNSSDEMICISAINAITVGKLTEYLKDLENLSKNSKSKICPRTPNLQLSGSNPFRDFQNFKNISSNSFDQIDGFLFTPL
jgi:hypothetical protein